MTRPRRPVEVAIVACALAGLAAAVYGGHAVHGGFISDAWAILALHDFAPETGVAGVAEHLLDEPNFSPRPLYAVYLAVLTEVLGGHMGFWLAWLGAMGVLMSVSLYVLLRELRLSALDAGIVATLVLVFPAATSLRLWTALVQAPLATALATLGFAIALRAFAAEGDRRLLLHTVSLATFVASLLLYEIALPVMLASVLLYRLRVPWREAAARWAIDCAVLLPLVLTVTRASSSSAETQDVHGAWDHAMTIADQALTLLTTIVLPFGSDRWYVLALIGLVPTAAILLRRQLAATDPAREALGRWLAVVLAGVVVIALGYAIFVPAIDYYAPLGEGIGDRINAVPSVGWVLLVYGTVMLAATMAFRGIPHAKRLTAGLGALTSLLLAASWMQSITRDIDAYERAYAEGQRVLATIERALPDPPPHSTIWAFGQPVEIALGVPVFGNTWDLKSSVQLRYRDPTLASYVAFEDSSFDCRRGEVAAGGSRYAVTDARFARDYTSRYGRTFFVDTISGRWEPILTRAQCRRAAASYGRSPALPLA